jgi:purine nucleosidase
VSWDIEHIAPRMRVISDNDYAGDPDGLVQLAHLLLSATVEVPFVISSHLPLDAFNADRRSAARGVIEARRVAALCKRLDLKIVAGSELALRSRTEPIATEAAKAIVAEALRDDTSLPLFVTCGGGLTEIASAWLMEPRIAERVTLVWIGGHEYDDVAPPPGAGDLEYNTSIDPTAAQVIFNDSDLHLWQVPRNTYRMAMTSRAELLLRMATTDLGRHLFERLGHVVDQLRSHGLNLGETYVLGDSPLVLLTALWSGFEPAPSSSPWTTRRCPHVLDSGLYGGHPDGRAIRVFTGIDTRLMFEDFYAKLALNS